MSNFEKFIKQSAEQYEVSYNANHWKKVEKELPRKKGSSWVWAAGVAIVGATLAIAFWPTEEPKQPFTPKETTNSKKIELPETPTQEPINTETTIEETTLPVVEGKNPAQESSKKTDLNTPEPIVKPEPKQEKVFTNTAPAGSSKSAEQSFVIIADRTEVCPGERIQFSANSQDPVTYRWTFGDGTESTLPSPTHQYKKAGNYSVSLETTSLLSGKKTRKLFDSNIQVNPKPQANFDYQILESKDFNQPVAITANSQEYSSVEWIIDGKEFKGKSVELEMNRKGNYPARLIVANRFGCYDTLQRSIVIRNDYNLLAPNAFTPDNDGINDNFIPFALKESGLRYEMKIVESNSGGLVFQGNQDGNGWNGTDFRTGKKAKQGNYSWIVTLYKKDGSIEKFQGNIQLLEM